MKTREQYIKETGNKMPDNQIAYEQWYQEYVTWLERRVVEYEKILKIIKHIEKKPHDEDTMKFVINGEHLSLEDLFG